MSFNKIGRLSESTYAVLKDRLLLEKEILKSVKTSTKMNVTDFKEN
jgi:hypothetical protein